MYYPILDGTDMKVHKQRLSYDFVKGFFEKNGCTLVSKHYKNARSKLDYICSCGNKSTIVFDSFRLGNRCKKCGSRRGAEKQRLNQEVVSRWFKEKNCTLHSEYVDAKTKLVFQCNECGKLFEYSWNRCQRWPGCYHTIGNRPRKEQCYQWRKDREIKAEQDVFRQKCYKLLQSALKSISKTKDSKTHDLLGYTYEDLQQKIKSHPRWDELKDSEWHLDHIYPIKAFVDHGISDLKIINALDNLQPLSQKENCSKQDTYDLKEFKFWLATKGIII